MNPKRVSIRQEAEGIMRCRGAEDGNGAGASSGKSGTRNLEAESIRSRVGSTRGCGKLVKTATEILNRL